MIVGEGFDTSRVERRVTVGCWHLKLNERSGTRCLVRCALSLAARRDEEGYDRFRDQSNEYASVIEGGIVPLLNDALRGRQVDRVEVSCARE